MQEWEVKLDQLTNSGVIGTYQYCEVDQIVLLDEGGNSAWNYFTHVHFSSKYDTVAKKAAAATVASTGIFAAENNPAVKRTPFRHGIIISP